jgi:hypothetical protein
MLPSCRAFKICWSQYTIPSLNFLITRFFDGQRKGDLSGRPMLLASRQLNYGLALV